MNIGGETKEITLEMVDIRIDSKEGFNVGMLNNEFVILNTTLTSELINEGIARETISKIQQLRKTMNFDIVDRIKVEYASNDEYENSIKDFIEFISSETLATQFVKTNEELETIDINGYNVGFKLTKV
jgi:isoleucyl-tRNA synthetase